MGNANAEDELSEIEKSNKMVSLSEIQKLWEILWENNNFY